jgi:CheY-like chemotaxis protein
MTKRSIEEGDPYAIIFMDNAMTTVNGPRAAQEIRSLGFEGLIVGVSGNVFEEDVKHFIECGADAVYAKPLKIDILKGIADHITGG